MEGSDSTIITIFIVSTLIVLVLVVAIVSFVLLYQRRMLQQEMRLRDMEMTHQNALLAASLDSQERERARIARDLHDSVGMMLSTLHLTIRQYGLKGEPDEARTALVGRASEMLGETIGTVRRISHDLLPPELEMLGLLPSLERIAADINEAGGLRVDVRFPNRYRRLDVKRELLLFRIVQELLSNTIRHSGATVASILIEQVGEALTMIYEDNGSGLGADSGHTNSGEGDGSGRQGLGMKGIESRARSLGAHITWNGNDSGGMHMRLRLPVNQQEEPRS